MVTWYNLTHPQLDLEILFSFLVNFLRHFPHGTTPILSKPNLTSTHVHNYLLFWQGKGSLWMASSLAPLQSMSENADMWMSELGLL